MTIVFSCANCGKRFEVDRTVAGKKAKCKQCGHIFVIPTPRVVAPQPASRQPASRRDDEDAWSARQAEPVPDPFDRFGLHEPTPAAKPAASTYLPSYADEEELPPPKRIGPTPGASRTESSASRWSSGRRGFWDGIPGPMYMALFGTVACAAVLALLVPSTGIFLMVAAGALFLILWLYGFLGMLVLPFQESAACGLMCMFVPFYALYYLITRWDTMRGPFLSGLAAYGIVVLTAIGMPAVNAARMAAQRAAADDELVRDEQPAGDDVADDDAADEPAAIPARKRPAPGARKRPAGPAAGRRRP